MPQVPLVLIENTRTLNFAALRSSKKCFNFISSKNSKSCKEKKSDLIHFEILNMLVFRDDCKTSVL